MALTFDDGPDPEHTPRLLEVLARHGAKATFFMVGARAARHPELVARVAAEGHEIGNHGWDHPSLPALPSAAVAGQLERTRAVLAPHGQALMRPPYGHQDLADPPHRPAARLPPGAAGASPARTGAATTPRRSPGTSSTGRRRGRSCCCTTRSSPTRTPASATGAPASPRSRRCSSGCPATASSRSRSCSAAARRASATGCRLPDRADMARLRLAEGGDGADDRRRGACASASPARASSPGRSRRCWRGTPDFAVTGVLTRRPVALSADALPRGRADQLARRADRARRHRLRMLGRHPARRRGARRRRRGRAAARHHERRGAGDGRHRAAARAASRSPRRTATSRASLAELDAEVRAIGFEPVAYVNLKGFHDPDPSRESMLYWSEKQASTLSRRHLLHRRRQDADRAGAGGERARRRHRAAGHDRRRRRRPPRPRLPRRRGRRGSAGRSATISCTRRARRACWSSPPARLPSSPPTIRSSPRCAPATAAPTCS